MRHVYLNKKRTLQDLIAYLLFAADDTAFIQIEFTK